MKISTKPCCSLKICINCTNVTLNVCISSFCTHCLWMPQGLLVWLSLSRHSTNLHWNIRQYFGEMTRRFSVKTQNITNLLINVSMLLLIVLAITCSCVEIQINLVSSDEPSLIYMLLGRKKRTTSRARFRSLDLWVMGPARFRCATLLL